jgi:hypothetical protein
VLGVFWARQEGLLGKLRDKDAAQQGQRGLRPVFRVLYTKRIHTLNKSSWVILGSGLAAGQGHLVRQFVYRSGLYSRVDCL